MCGSVGAFAFFDASPPLACGARPRSDAPKPLLHADGMLAAAAEVSGGPEGTAISGRGATIDNVGGQRSQIHAQVALCSALRLRQVA